MEDKLSVYVDCDDTILNSSVAVIDILNKYFNKNKTIEDLHDWNYRSIEKTITADDICKIYESDEFWSIVKVNAGFLNFYQRYKTKFNWIVVSKGTKRNLLQKKIYLEKIFDNFQFIGVEIFNPDKQLSKSSLDMSNSIQIDDVFEELEDTNANIKILLTNNRKFYWNKIKPNVENLYAVQNWEEISQILEFFNKNLEFVCKGC